MAGSAPFRLLVLLALSPTAWAETPPAVPPAPAEPAASAKLDRLFSGNPPKFEPAKTAAPAPAGPATADQPKNGIIRLPLYLVREPRPIRSEDVMTDQARSEALVKRYVGEPTGLDVLLNKYTINTLWKKIPLLGSHSDFGTPGSASLNYSERIATDYSKIEAKRKYLEALGVSADMPPTKEKPEAKTEPADPVTK